MRCPKGKEVDRSVLKLDLDGVALHYNPEPNLLGPCLDEKLTFKKTALLTKKKVLRKMAVARNMVHLPEHGRFAISNNLII